MNISPVFSYTVNNKNGRIRQFSSSPSMLNLPKFDSVEVNNKANFPLKKSSPAFGFLLEGNAGKLYEMTANSGSAQKLVEELTQNPLESLKKAQGLVEKFGLNTKAGINDFFNWCLAPDGYYGAYENYVRHYFDKAGSISELLKFQPNWAPWKLEEKAFQLEHSPQGAKHEDVKAAIGKSYNYMREINFTIGELPQIFESPDEYAKLIDSLKKSNAQRMEINLGNRSYNLKRLNGGQFSDKFIYLMETQGQKFILKLDRINVEDCSKFDNRLASLAEQRNIRKNKYLAADSVYSNSCISRYLELNGCDEMSKLLYYDHKTHSAVFEYIEDVHGDVYQQIDYGDSAFDLNKVNDVYKNLNALGIYLNDPATINGLTRKDGKKILIDLGHCNYMDIFKPGVRGYHTAFSNTVGPNIGASLASMLRVILNK